MTLRILQVEMEPRPLYGWAKQVGITSRDRSYLVHSAMRAAFGMAAPQPFVVFTNALNPKIKVLGYSSTGKTEMLTNLELAEPSLMPIFPPHTLLEKSMPAFQPGMEMAFRVECCPVSRITTTEGKVREKDVFLSMCDAQPEGGVDREEVYAAWTAKELAREGAAEMLGCAMQGFRFFTPVRRNKNKQPRSTGQRPWVSLKGTLRVKSETAFASLLARGVGRHRAFGLGMLLLRPI